MKFPGLEIELKTPLSQNRWYGSKEKFNFPNLSMPAFLKKLSEIHYESLHNDNPFADYFITEIDNNLMEKIKLLNEYMTKVDSILSLLPDNLTCDEYDFPTLKLTINSGSPIGYKFMHLLVGIDQLFIQSRYLIHYGLMPTTKVSKMTNNVQKVFRRSFTMVCNFKPNLKLTREQLFNDDVLSLFLDLTGKDAKSILLGVKRSPSLHLLNKEQLEQGKQLVSKIKKMEKSNDK